MKNASTFFSFFFLNVVVTIIVIVIRTKKKKKSHRQIHLESRLPLLCLKLYECNFTMVAFH